MAAFNDLLGKLSIAPEHVAYVGDDLIDWPVMAEIGLSVAGCGCASFVDPCGLIMLPHQRWRRGAVREV